jgi:hypothetical protein
MCVLSISFLYHIQGQGSGEIQGPAKAIKFHHVTLSVETEFPVQHLARYHTLSKVLKDLLEYHFLFREECLVT